MNKKFRSALVVLACAIAPTLTAAPQATTTTLAPPPDSVSIGTVVTLTASVEAGSSPVSPGLVTFHDGTTAIGSAQLIAAGTATIKVRLGPGAHAITANFAGTTAYAKSSSSAEPLTVGPIATATAISFTDSNAGYTLTGTLASFGWPGPTGTVSFRDQTSGITLGSVALGVGSLAFLPQQAFAAGLNASSVAVGDFNNDGIPDVATVGGDTASVAFWQR